MLLTSANTHNQRIYTRETPRSQNNQNGHQNNTPLVLSLSQIQGGGGLLILNSSSNSSSSSMSHQNLVSPLAVTSFVCNTTRSNHMTSSRQKKNQSHNIVLKQEAMDTSCCHSDNKMDVTNGNMSEMYELNYCREKSVSISEQSTPSKRMETNDISIKQQSYSESVVLLNKNDHVASNFFNETLDLSHEDIQRTLSANMPLCELDQGSKHSSTGNTSGSSTNKTEEGRENGVIVSEMNPMDFMEGEYLFNLILNCFYLPTVKTILIFLILI